MIGNLLNILAGLWLAYSAIFANPPGDMNNTSLAVVAVAIVVFGVGATNRPHEVAKWDEHRAGFGAFRRGGGALGDRRGTARLLLDYPACRHRGRHCGAVVDFISAGDGAVSRFVVSAGFGCPPASRSAAGAAASAVAHHRSEGDQDVDRRPL